MGGWPRSPRRNKNQLGAPCLDFQTWDLAPGSIELRVTQRLNITVTLRVDGAQSHRIAFVRLSSGLAQSTDRVN